MARQGTRQLRFGMVQVIGVSWSKASRGDKGARARNAVPLALEVPAADLAATESGLCLDLTGWGERNAFAAPLNARRELVPLTKGLTHDCVTVAATPEGLQVRYEYSPDKSGAPDRWFSDLRTGYGQVPSRTLLVRSGQWARVRYNGRFSCVDSGTWWYEQDTLNVAWFEGAPDGRVFLDREPHVELNLLADLW